MTQWTEFNAFTDFLKRQPEFWGFNILAYHECEPLPVEKYSERDERANGMVFVHRNGKLVWKALYRGQNGRRYFKDGKHRVYIE